MRKKINIHSLALCFSEVHCTCQYQMNDAWPFGGRHWDRSFLENQDMYSPAGRKERVSEWEWERERESARKWERESTVRQRGRGGGGEGEREKAPNASHLSCDEEVSQCCHGGTVPPEVGDWFHDIPRVLPPGQPSKEAKGEWHEPHGAPHRSGGLSRWTRV